MSDKFLAMQQRKGATPIVMLTAYSKSMAQLIDPHVDIILVGDSVGMTIYGFDTTRHVTLDMMINHGAAVCRGTKKAMVVVDMPYGTYEHDKDIALGNARRIIAETGCGALKLEGGTELANTVRYLVESGIDVMGHVGLMPQSVEPEIGFKVKGRTENEFSQIEKDALAIQDAGAFSIVLEGVIEPLAAKITRDLKIPTIGIGASPACDGQVLVIDDVLGTFNDFTPKFVKHYAELSPQISQAVQNYANDVLARKFPALEHCFTARKTI